MTQQTAREFWGRTLLLQSLSWIGVLSYLSSGLVLAQTESSIDTIVPTIEAPKPPAAAKPVRKVASIAHRAAPAPKSVASARRERLRQKLLSSPAPARQERVRQAVSTPPAAQSSVPTRAVAKPRTNLPSPAQARRTRLLEKTAINTASDYNNAYIDPTDYSIGATRGYKAPSAVVLSERSTGCKAVLRQGQRLSGSVCGTAQSRRTRVARFRGTQRINTVRLSRPQSPNWARRSRGVAISGISPVRVGPISVSSTGFRATRRTPSSQGQIAFAKATSPSERHVVYYNPPLRPTGQPSNVNTQLMYPLTVPATITSIFGWRIHPITGNQRFHSGTDLGAPQGTPVLAAYAGNVAIADFLGGYGLTVVLEHNEYTQQTLYGHLSEIFVQPGEWVEQGTVIGHVGSTGNSTGPHLHFETRQLTPEGWVATDPGAQLESSLAQLVEALRTAHSSQQPGNRG